MRVVIPGVVAWRGVVVACCPLFPGYRRPSCFPLELDAATKPRSRLIFILLKIILESPERIGLLGLVLWSGLSLRKRKEGTNKSVRQGVDRTVALESGGLMTRKREARVAVVGVAKGDEPHSRRHTCMHEGHGKRRRERSPDLRASSLTNCFVLTNPAGLTNKRFARL